MDRAWDHDMDRARDTVHRQKALLALEKLPVTAPASMREAAAHLRDSLREPCTTRDQIDALLEAYDQLPETYVPEYDDFVKSLAPLRAYINNLKSR